MFPHFRGFGLPGTREGVQELVLQCAYHLEDSEARHGVLEILTQCLCLGGATRGFLDTCFVNALVNALGNLKMTARQHAGARDLFQVKRMQGVLVCCRESCLLFSMVQTEKLLPWTGWWSLRSPNWWML